MDDATKQAIKEYLIENLTIENNVTSDIYGNWQDQIDITIKLEGNIVATTRINPFDAN
jgi:hypothetical protein